MQLACTNSHLALRRFFADVHDVVLEDEQIRGAFSRQTHHILVVVLDPASHYFAVRKLDAYGLLLFAQLFQVSGFLKCLVRRWSLSATANSTRSIGIERHVGHFTLRSSQEWNAARTGCGKTQSREVRS